MTGLRVFLLNPPIELFRQGFVHGKRRLWPPTALAILAAELERRGHSLELLDANALDLTAGAIQSRIARYAPDVVVYSGGAFDTWQCPNPTFDPTASFSARLRESMGRRPALVLIGPQGTMLPEAAFQSVPGLDYVVRGEPERTTADLIDALAAGRDPGSIRGVSQSTPDGGVVHAPDAPMIDDLDALPLPAYGRLPLERYVDGTSPDERFVVTATSRGCTLHCSFCNKTMFGHRMRNRSIERVLEELELLVKVHGVTRVLFHDQNFLADAKRAKEFARRLALRNLPITWRCQSTLFRADLELLELLKRSGCSEIHIGLESGSAATLKRLRKGRIEDFVQIVELGKRAGLTVLPNNLIGLPGDTVTSVRESMRFFHDQGFFFRPWVAIPYPGTALHRAGVAEGRVVDGDWVSAVDGAGLVDNALDEESLRMLFREAGALNARLHRRTRRRWALVRRVLPRRLHATVGM